MSVCPSANELLDMLCSPCFYEVRAKPDVGAGILAVENKLLGNENKETLLYGVKAGHPLRFLDDKNFE